MAMEGGDEQFSFASLFGEDAAESHRNAFEANSESDAPSFEQLFGETSAATNEESTQGRRETRYLSTLEAPIVPGIGAGEVHLAKIPTTLHFEPRQWGPDAVAQLDDEGQVITADNVVRWDYEQDDTGRRRAISNARIVRWDNGDVHLYIGNEIYDLTPHDIAQENVHLFSRLPNGMIRCQAKFSSSMVVRPNLMRRSQVNELLTKRIHSRASSQRDLRMRLTTAVNSLQPKEPVTKEDKMVRRRQRILEQSGVAEASGDAPVDEEEQERVAKLRDAQDSVPDIKRRRITES
eukprot:TRINITY_DN2160_c0_g1_i2.p1 TRINITY_DN2160_c0_g1~~TRINITY_DN2160_c0_g1_i2.p1  ORF type:complete len:292 (+),score=32.99 TRINITY_DN2160_c0_g1_i2:674-1549(+)